MCFWLFDYSTTGYFWNDFYGDPHVHVVDPGYDYAVCGPVQLQQNNMYDQPSEIRENEPNSYEVPVSTSQNQKEEWHGDRNPAKRKNNANNLLHNWLWIHFPIC